MPRTYFKKNNRRFKNRQEKLFALSEKSTIFVKTLLLESGIPGVLIQYYVPKSSVSKKAEKRGNHKLRPGRKSITITSYDAYLLIDALQRCLPKKELLEEPEPLFWPFSYPNNSKVFLPSGEIIDSKNVSSRSQLS